MPLPLTLTAALARSPPLTPQAHPQPRQDLALFSTHLTAEEMAPRAMVRS